MDVLQVQPAQSYACVGAFGRSWASGISSGNLIRTHASLHGGGAKADPEHGDTAPQYISYVETQLGAGLYFYTITGGAVTVARHQVEAHYGRPSANMTELDAPPARRQSESLAWGGSNRASTMPGHSRRYSSVRYPTSRHWNCEVYEAVRLTADCKEIVYR